MKLELDVQKIKDCRQLASTVATDIVDMVRIHSTVSVERTSLRILGLNAAHGMYPVANFVVDQLQKEKLLESGALRHIANACLEFKCTPEELGKKFEPDHSFSFAAIKQHPKNKVEEKARSLSKAALAELVKQRKVRQKEIDTCGDPADTTFKKPPLKYVIVASGNIFEDVVQARSAAQAGADVIAVIRSTAQSLLDYVPNGSTTEGFGGTYATQENFRIMRAALDEEGNKLKRYIRLTNYASGLCMPEISALAAIERLDFLLCDSLYGILFRDINMKRTLIDQHLSRQICALSEIYINTGEDNYLTTADALENGHQVLASQFINERFALEANMKEQFMGLGHAMEMDPFHENVLLYEWARAQMSRDIFPNAPLKYMPPTRHMEGDIFFSHVYDAMFNLVSVATHQGIHLLGMPTEAMHTPMLMDRFIALKSTGYIFNAAKDFSSEITFRKDGKINGWARKVLDDSLGLLESVEKVGLMKAIEDSAFADISRTETGGKGYEGVFKRAPDYLNPILDMLEAQDYEH